MLIQRARLPKLRRGRLVQIEANHLDARPIDELAHLSLVLRFAVVVRVQFQVRRDENRKSGVEPGVGFFPATRGDGTDRHEYVSLTELNTIPSVHRRLSGTF